MRHLNGLTYWNQEGFPIKKEVSGIEHKHYGMQLITAMCCLMKETKKDIVVWNFVDLWIDVTACKIAWLMLFSMLSSVIGLLLK